MCLIGVGKMLAAATEAETGRGTAPRPVKRDSKVTFRVNDVKVVARKGECRIVMDTDFTEIPRDKLEEALIGFAAKLGE